MEPFIGEVLLFAGNFAPRNWAYCDGQLIPISQNTALYSILGTTYGGDGVTTFALPDLRGRAPLGPRQGPGLSMYQEGEKGGTEYVTLLANQMPMHNHSFHAETSAADSTSAQGNMLALPANPIYAEVVAADDRTMASQSVQTTGGNQAHYNLQPYIAINYIIALYGIFPSRG
ncbi:phage tail protein [Anianabacter salinae]|uniref:phage tail protein n=1 Tax=Anianabacter salinae TaxID=2851023 RepID=UPI00225E5F17|nr:tail fiber protein [Anianabacter salinae]MBV0913170.1 tail fiber protein [Anianabacter salinae]